MSGFTFEPKLDLSVKPSAGASAAEDEGDDGDNEPVPEEESTATFVPVVQLEVVEVKTHEEDENVIYKQRAKLFIYGETLLDKGTGIKTWRERGIGDIKLLKHKETNRIRVLMRQEKTMKVICNHFLDPRIQVIPNAGSDKSWVWNCFDFAENELVETTFAVRFGSPEIAQEFKAAYTSGQAEMTALLAGADSSQGSAEADAAADAIASLNVKSESTEASATAESSSSDAAPEASA